MKGKTTILMRFLLVMLCLLLCASPVLAAQEYLIPGGFAVGIELTTRGIMILGVEEATPAEKAGLRKGDIIVKINGEDAAGVETLRNAAGRGTVVLRVTRDGREAEFLVQPGANGRLGLLVRDSVAGIGTVSYIDPETGRYGALGHGVNDLAAARLLPIRDGVLVAAEIGSVRKGARGTPGELKGVFDVAQRLGTVEANTACGIFGQLYDVPRTPAIPVAKASEIQTGAATILANVSGTSVQEYAIRIDRIAENAENGRDLLLTVTDPALLAVTGGIVQGMSGSPILQNGRIVGAVTHVLVNDPTRGYGILIENMLDAAG